MWSSSGTGFLVPPAIYPETDGPIAAALLARALDILGCKTFIVCEKELLPCLQGACVAAGVSPFENAEMVLSIAHTVGLITLPTDKQEFAATSAGIFDRLHPKAMVSIEHPGQNAEGRYYAAFGRELPGWVAPLDILLKQVRDRGGFTVGIGDLGNEAGLGNAQPEIKSVIPFGDKIATVIKSNAPIMSVVSEMGTYGLIAALTAVTGKMLLHDVRLQEAVTRQAVLSGAVDGVSGKREAGADLIDVKYLVSFIELLHAILIYTEMHSATRPYCLEFIQSTTGKYLHTSGS